VKFHDFQNTVMSEYSSWRKIDSTMRLGQVCFNLLTVFNPKIANEIRATPLDPFYKDYVSQDTWEYLQERW